MAQMTTQAILGSILASPGFCVQHWQMVLHSRQGWIWQLQKKSKMRRGKRQNEKRDSLRSGPPRSRKRQPQQQQQRLEVKLQPLQPKLSHLKLPWGAESEAHLLDFQQRPASMYTYQPRATRKQPLV